MSRRKEVENKGQVDPGKSQIEAAVQELERKLETQSTRLAVKRAIHTLESAGPQTVKLRGRIKKVLADVQARLNENLIHRLKVGFLRSSEYISEFKRLDWDEIEEALRANPDKLAVLRKLEESDFKPSFFGIEGDSFVFSGTFEYPKNAFSDPELRGKTKRKRRNDLHLEAERMISQYGAELPDDEKLPKGMFRYIVKVPKA